MNREGLDGEPARAMECLSHGDKETGMNTRIRIAAVIVAALPLAAAAIGKNEKGCLVGGAVGGVGGHLLGNHALLGAAAGCGVGALVANEQKKENGRAKQAQREEDKRNETRRQREARLERERLAREGR
jgi:hypothetical protein